MLPSRLLTAAALFCVPPCTLRAQELSCLHRTIPVSFRDAQDLPINDISFADLEGTLRGKPVKVLSLTRDTRPHRVVLVLDASGSMGMTFGGNRSPWFLEVVLARNFFAVTRGQVPLAMLTFKDRVDEIAGFTPDNSSFADKLQKIGDSDYRRASVKGYTALLDALLQGLEMLDHPTSADAVFVLTDGGDNVSKQSFSAVARHFERTTVRLFSILIRSHQHGYRNHIPEEFDAQDLRVLARNTGGEMLTTADWQGNKVILQKEHNDKVTTEETLRRLYQAILGSSLLEIELSASMAKPQSFDLRLTPAARKRWKDAKLTYPEKLIACDSGATAGRN